MKRLLYFVLIAGIFILSFFCYSSNFFALLGSDDAIQILMIHDFKLPHDLYFWGQDRYGSLIPLLGQVFYRVAGLSALTSESVTHYLLLIAGYFALATLLKSNFSRLLLAIVWFFPPIRLIDLLRLNIGQEYALLAISIFIINRLYESNISRSRFKKHLMLLSITVLMILAVWVSDLAVISVFLILVFQIYTSWNFGNLMDRLLKWRTEILYSIAGTIIGAAFIFYGKYFADKSPSYNNFNDFGTILSSLGLFGKSIKELLLFTAYEPFTSAFLYAVTFISITLFVMRGSIRMSSNQKKWFWFFILDTVLIFFLIMISKWSYNNGVPRRYFTSTYITISMALLIASESLIESDIKKALRIIMMVSVVIAGAGSLYNLKLIWPKTLKPRVEIVREFESLGRIGIIGNYWNSYINSVTNPDQIVATPDDHSSVRNRGMAARVMQCDTIYIIRDGWFEIFPDSLNQFGSALYKNGDEFRMGDCYVCRYRK